ncbi:MAG: hypothetical protein HYX48_07725 [Chlamydiales bacterium]|nr:hypothetical protein [Chlamydiales bacterium]
MSVSSLGAVVGGLGSGVWMPVVKLAETDEFRKEGQTTPFTIGFQFLQQAKALEFVEGAMKVVGREPFSQLAHVVIYLSPILLLAARDILPEVCGLESEIIKEIVDFVEKNISTLCHVAALVSSLVQILFGSALFGVAALAVLGVGLLYEHNLLPESVKEIAGDVAVPLFLVTTLVSGLWIDTIIGAIALAALTADCWTPLAQGAFAAIQECCSGSEGREHPRGRVDLERARAALGVHDDDGAAGVEGDEGDEGDVQVEEGAEETGHFDTLEDLAAAKADSGELLTTVRRRSGVEKVTGGDGSLDGAFAAMEDAVDDLLVTQRRKPGTRTHSGRVMGGAGEDSRLTGT